MPKHHNGEDQFMLLHLEIYIIVLENDTCINHHGSASLYPCAPDLRISGNTIAPPHGSRSLVACYMSLTNVALDLALNLRIWNWYDVTRSAEEGVCRVLVISLLVLMLPLSQGVPI